MEESPTGHHRLVAMHDVAEYVQRQEEEQSAYDEMKIRGAKVVPYWSSKLKEYLFDNWYGSSSQTSGFCSNSDHRAATPHKTSASTITLCPRSFQTSNSALSNKNMIAIRSKTPAPMKYADRNKPKASSEITSYIPSSATLFHEWFHLVLGNQETYPDEGEEYAVSEMLTKDFADSFQNPETFNMVAIGYDYTLHSGQDGNGYKVEFFSGYATQGSAAL